MKTSKFTDAQKAFIIKLGEADTTVARAGRRKFAIEEDRRRFDVGPRNTSGRFEAKTLRSVRNDNEERPHSAIGKKVSAELLQLMCSGSGLI